MPEGRAVLCLGTDKATQHVGPIRDKVHAYRQALAAGDARARRIRIPIEGVDFGLAAERA